MGAKIDVPTLTGPTELDVRRGTETGEVFRLRGQGMPNPHGGANGDLLVQTYIEVPKKLTTRQEQLLRELAELEDANVSPHRKSFLEKLAGNFTGEEE